MAAPGRPLLSAKVEFRAEARMVADILGYQQERKLRDFSDAARELMDSASPDLARAVAESRSLGIDPVAAIRAAIAAKISNP